METLTAFEHYLTDLDRSPLTVRGYLADLAHFSHWFEQTNGEPLCPERMTPSDVKEYKQHLLLVERLKASTVILPRSLRLHTGQNRQAKSKVTLPIMSNRSNRWLLPQSGWIRMSSLPCSAPLNAICRSPSCATPNAGSPAAGTLL